MATRDVWPHEAHDFTPWLLANADVLAQALNMDLELSVAEHPVGDFFLDLIGTNPATGERVIVENQLEVSDHNHLGQILTYAGGTDPTNIVWVAPRFREEHRAALDWLNKRTDENTRFFAVEVSVVRIGDSLPAPLMTVVVEPNDWGKTVKASAAITVMTDRSKLYQQFWARYLDQLRKARPTWTKASRAPTENNINLTAGISGITFGTNFGRQGLCSEIYFGTQDPAVNDHWYATTAARRAELEAHFGEPLAWQPLPDRNGSRISIYRPGSIEDTDNWPTYIDWFIDTQTRLRAAFDTLGGLKTIRRGVEDQQRDENQAHNALTDPRE